MDKAQIYRLIAAIATAIVTIAGICLGCTSCQVTRNISTTQSIVQRGDTTTTMTSKTIETYSAKKTATL